MCERALCYDVLSFSFASVASFRVHTRCEAAVGRGQPEFRRSRMAPEAPPAKKAKWSAARKKAAKEARSAAAEEASGGGSAKRRFAASGRLVLAGAECGYCGASATCEVDPQDELAAYCRRCWSEWEQCGVWSDF